MIRRKKSVLKVIRFGGYPFDILLAINVSAKRIERALKLRKVELTKEVLDGVRDFNSRGRVIVLPGGEQVLRLRDWDGRPFHWACMAHEIFHAVANLMDKVGVGYCGASEEAFAYAIQDLTQRVCIELER